MQIPSFMCIDTMVIELPEFNQKKEYNMNKMLLAIIWTKGIGILGTLITFDMFYAVKSLKVKLT